MLSKPKWPESINSCHENSCKETRISHKSKLQTAEIPQGCPFRILAGFLRDPCGILAGSLKDFQTFWTKLGQPDKSMANPKILQQPSESMLPKAFPEFVNFSRLCPEIVQNVRSLPGASWICPELVWKSCKKPTRIPKRHGKNPAGTPCAFLVPPCKLSYIPPARVVRFWVPLRHSMPPQAPCLTMPLQLYACRGPACPLGWPSCPHPRYRP